MRHFVLAAFLAAGPLSACALSRPVENGIAGQWMLFQMNGADAPAFLTLDSSDLARFAGQGPCNRWSAAQTAVLPALNLGAITATEIGCADLAAETALFAALAGMTRAEVQPDGTLLLMAPDGRRLRFTRLLAD
jgi:heat shock protein HslJ